MFEDIGNAFNLETEVLITIAIGYLGFRIAYAERSNPENNGQTLFLTVCFSALFQFSSSLATQLLSFGPSSPYAHIIGSVTTLLAAIWWRRKGMDAYAKVWLGTGGTHLDGLSSVLDTIRTSSKFKPVSLLVQIDDGPTLYCDDLNQFKNHPFGPCLIGGDGSVALYVTHTHADGMEDWEETPKTALDQITIVPADRVKLIETRIGK